MVIGLTGQIGAGKTAAAKILAGFGATVIDADRIGHEVVDGSPALRKQLARAFGNQILDGNGRVRRKKLAAVAFADEAGKEKLNRLVHPHLLRELRKQVRRVVRSGRVAVIDAALLLYWNMDDEVDCVLVIHTSRRRRLARMAERGISAVDALAREKAQLRYEEFRRRADVLLLNNGSKEDLKRKLKTVWGKLTAGLT